MTLRIVRPMAEGKSEYLGLLSGASPSPSSMAIMPYNPAVMQKLQDLQDARKGPPAPVPKKTFKITEVT